ncbi:PTS ascorbate transporter subunit IIC, partial [Salmonella enterica subsp. enterica serovar Kentucky]
GLIGAFDIVILISFLPVLFLRFLGGFGFANPTFWVADFGVFGILLGNVGVYLSPLANRGVVVALFAILVAYKVLAKKKKATA